MSPLHQKIWHLAWPMIVANLSLPLLGLVDAAILGHLDGARYLAAVALGSTVLSFLYWGFGFLRMGTTGLAAQAFGRQDHQHSRLIIGQSLLLGLLLGLLILALSPWLLAPALALLGPPPQTGELALSYMAIRIFSAPAVLVNYAIIGWLIGRQQTRWPLLISLFTNGLNIVLDVVLIIGLGLNSDGAAWATLIAEYSGCLLALWLLRRQLKALPGRLSLAALWQWRALQQLLRVNRHLFVRTLLLLASFAFFTAQGAAQGEVVLAANSLLIHLLMFTAFGLDGIAHAAEALVGDCIGGRDQRRFIATCKACGQWSLLIALALSLGFWLLEQPLLALLSDIPAVIASARSSYTWLIALPLIAVWSYLLDGIFIGATRSQAMQTSMLVSVLVVYLPCWYFSQGWGNHGLWLAFCAFNAARGITLALSFYRYQRQQRWLQQPQ